eukprot:1303352-Amphidinium_carterae.1
MLQLRQYRNLPQYSLRVDKVVEELLHPDKDMLGRDPAAAIPKQPPSPAPTNINFTMFDGFSYGKG